MKRFTIAFAFAFALLLCTSMWAQTNYSFQTVNYPNDNFTQLLGINNSLLIAGYHNMDQNSGFTLRLPFLFTTENYPNSMMTQVIGINNNGTTDGFYVDNAGNTHGFTDTKGTFATVDYPGTPFNQLLGQNDMGQAAGYYSLSADNTTPDFPYVYDEARRGNFSGHHHPRSRGRSAGHRSQQFAADLRLLHRRQRRKPRVPSELRPVRDPRCPW